MIAIASELLLLPEIQYYMQDLFASIVPGDQFLDTFKFSKVIVQD